MNLLGCRKYILHPGSLTLWQCGVQKLVAINLKLMVALARTAGFRIATSRFSASVHSYESTAIGKCTVQSTDNREYMYVQIKIWIVRTDVQFNI